jgi:hypothetical protein
MIAVRDTKPSVKSPSSHATVTPTIKEVIYGQGCTRGGTGRMGRLSASMYRGELGVSSKEDDGERPPENSFGGRAPCSPFLDFFLKFLKNRK